METFKVVIADYDYDIVDQEISMLKKIGAEVITAQCKTEEEVIEVAKDADGIICQYAPITKKVIKALTNCKVIARYGIGFDTIDIPAASDQEIIVCNVTDYCWDEVSDHAFALLIAQARKVVKQNEAVKDGIWDYKAGLPINRLRGQVIGLVGFGHIAQSLTPKAQAFGLKVIAYDPFINTDIAEQMNVDLVDMRTLCEKADFISIHTPLNEHTYHLIGKEQFEQMKQSAYIINTSRGPIIDETALVEALKGKKIAGAGLDVLEVEPIVKDNLLRKMDNVIINPHIAYYSTESEAELKRKTTQNIIDVLTGYYPDYIVNENIKEVVVLNEK